MLQTLRKSDKIILLFILLLGGFLRFYRYSDFSFCSDEYSALERVHFNSFAEMISKGATFDGHPPLVASFLYFWIKAAGDSVAAVRLPFVIAGAFCIFFAWLIAARWFNPTAALFIALCMAVLDYTLYYSRIARPYSPGLLFSLINIWLWTNLLLNGGNRKWLNALGYGITAALCMYTHHFCFLTVLVAGVTGLFIVPKKTLKYYLAGAAFAFLLYIPGLKIFYVQFIEVGGLGTGSPFYWLDKPTPGYIFDYLWICLNESYIVAVIISLTSIVSFVAFRSQVRITKFHSISLLVFLLPYLIGYFYSVYRSAVLQDRVLIFTFPYLLFFIFSFIPDTIKRLWKILILSLVTAVILFSTVIEKDFYNPGRYDQFPAITKKMIEYCNFYGDSNITAAANVFSKFRIDYHLQREGRPVRLAEAKVHTSDDFPAFDKLVSQSKTSYFMYAWISHLNPCEILQIIQKYYPYTVEREWYWKGEIYLFSRGKANKNAEIPKRFYSTFDFETAPPRYWSLPDSVLSDTIVLTGKKSSVVYNRHQFSPTFSATFGEIFSSVDEILYSRVEAYIPEQGANATLCLALEDKSGTYEWHAIDFDRYIDTTGSWVPVFIHIRVPRARSKDDVVKIFVWNTGEKKIYIDNFEVWVEEGNPMVFGKRNDLGWLESR